MGSIPFGPEHKDGPWGWGSWFVGLVGVLFLWALVQLDLLMPFRWAWPVFLFLAFGFALSLPSGRDYAKGRSPRRKGKVVDPTIDIRGQEGSTYVVIDPPKTGIRIRPRDLTPGWWFLYTVVWRMPVALGDFVLTVLWRAMGRVRGTGSSVDRLQVHLETLEHPGRRDPPNPSGDEF